MSKLAFKTVGRAFAGVVAGFLVAASSITYAADRELVVSLGEIPNRAEMGPDGMPRGTYVEMFRKIDEAFDGVSFKIGVFPFARSFNNVESGRADMHFPLAPSSGDLTHTYVPEALLSLPLVLYSRQDVPLRPGEDWSGEIVEAIGGGQNREFSIEIGTENNPGNGLKKVSLGRIHGFIGEQSVVDSALKALDLTNIHREYLKSIDLGIAVQGNKNGAKLSRELVEVIKAMKADHETKVFLDSIFPPYVDWQMYWTPIHELIDAFRDL